MSEFLKSGWYRYSARSQEYDSRSSPGYKGGAKSTSTIFWPELIFRFIQDFIVL
jgi:hypothetical protein